MTISIGTLRSLFIRVSDLAHEQAVTLDDDGNTTRIRQEVDKKNDDAHRRRQEAIRAAEDARLMHIDW